VTPLTFPKSLSVKIATFIGSASPNAGVLACAIAGQATSGGTR
jgi:hypothetical protein